MIKNRYWIMDIRRAFFSITFFLSVMGIFLAWFISSQNGKGLEESVLGELQRILYSGTSIIIVHYIFTVLPYGTAFCEDMECKYIRYLAVRGNLKHYVLSKVLTIYFSSICAMLLGSIIFFILLKMEMPWATEGFLIENADSTGLSFLLRQQHFFLWILLYTLQKGMWYGILAVFAAYLSLYINNKLLVLSVPILANQLLIETNVFGMASISPLLNIPRVFDSKYVIWGENGMHYLWSLVVSMVFGILFVIAIYHKVKKSL